jgi:ribosomal protein L22
MQVAVNRNLDKSTVVIQRIFVNEGQRLKRYQGHSRGRIDPFQKQYSHLCLVIKGEPKAVSRRRTAKTETADQEKKEGE